MDKVKKKLSSRKLWAFLVWVAITILVLIIAPEFTEKALNLLGVVTTIYIGGQAAVDAVGKLRGRNE